MCMLSNPGKYAFWSKIHSLRIQKFAHSPDLVRWSWKLFCLVFWWTQPGLKGFAIGTLNSDISREFCSSLICIFCFQVITSDTLCFTCDRLVIHQHDETSGPILIYFLRSVMILPHYNTSKLREKRNREFNPEWTLQISSRCYLKERRKNDFDQFAMKSSLEHSRTLVGDL